MSVHTPLRAVGGVLDLDPGRSQLITDGVGGRPVLGGPRSGALVEHVLTAKGIAQFVSDWEKTGQAII